MQDFLVTQAPYLHVKLGLITDIQNQIIAKYS